jgi:cytochrome c553
MKTFAALLLLALLAAPFAVAAQAPGAAGQCVACHGANGQGNPAMKAPRLAGQNAAYLARQLEAYANGARKNPVMEPIAKGLDRSQREAVAQHYAALEAPAAAGKGATPARGRQLATVGDNKLRVQACANCHGPDGIGSPPVPYLAGQQQAYLLGALQEWKDGARQSDPSGQMPRIGAQLGDADMKALAQYFAALQPPSPNQLAGRGPANAAGAAAPQSSGAGTTAPQGVGIEQGSPTTGGNQGTGGAGGANTNNPSGANPPAQGSGSR